jgi:predicted dehydrogenase
MTLQVAIIGMGKMGRIRKQMLDAHPGFKVVALCDLNAAYADEFPDLTFSIEWEKILNYDLDAIFVSTFNRIAPDIVCSALEKGLHVFCEKPPGRTVQDVERIIATEKSAPNQVLKFGFNHRYHYAVMEAKSIIDSEKYGRILWARGLYGKAGGLYFEKDWRSNKDLAGGGILIDQGIHMLDLMRYFMGDFVDVKSFVENCYWKDVNLEDNVFALMKTADGKVASIHSSATQWKHKFSLDLFMENGYLSINGILSSTRSYGEESITFARKQFETETRAFGRPREETIFFDTDDSWRFEIDEFYDCITGSKDKPQGNSEDAHEVMKLVDMIYKAAN